MSLVLPRAGTYPLNELLGLWAEQLEQLDRQTIKTWDSPIVVLRAPNGTRWRLEVDNAGALGTSLIP